MITRKLKLAQGGVPAARLHARLFEHVHPAAAALLREQGLRVTETDGAPTPRELPRALASAQAVGVRSRTSLDAATLERASELLVVGCFAVGTNNVDLDAATRRGIPVFHAPHSSTRSVAELTLGLMLALARRIVEKSHLARRGVWAKSAEGCHELRGRTLGIVGYGHVGSQVSVLAEALGMRVVFHDIADCQPLGNAQAVATLEQVLRVSDFVTLHVPGGESTRRLIGAREMRVMRPGACLVNTSRGSVVDERALEAALRGGKLAGAALDVLQVEPAKAGGRVASPLRRMEQVVITPHVGGSTVEAQRRIGEAVARKMLRYLAEGTTTGSVNFPEVSLARVAGSHRLVHVHRNVPGMLAGVNGLLGALGANVEAQYLKTNELIGYLVLDVDRAVSQRAMAALATLPETIRTRRLS